MPYHNSSLLISKVLVFHGVLTICVVLAQMGLLWFALINVIFQE
jgi:hypothetical protein